MHICYICREYPPSLRGGGISSYIKEMAQGMYQAGHQVTVICASDDTRKESIQEDNGVTVIRLKGGDFIIPQIEKRTILRRFRQTYRFFSYRKRIFNTVLQLKNIDIIEVAEFGAENYYLDKLNIPVLIRLHAPSLILEEIKNNTKGISRSNWYNYWQSLQELKLIKKTPYITSCSFALKKIISSRLSIPEERISVIYNPIRIEAWENYKKENFNISKNIRIILPGAVYSIKGGEDLVKACKIIHHETNHTIDYTWMGKKGTFGDYMQSMYGKYDWFHLPGAVSREQIMKMYTEVDIVCIPSWWENMPMACIEAMLCGAIVIGTDTGGISEIITDSLNGFLVPTHSPRAIAEKIKHVLSLSESERKQISKNAQQHIIEHFNIQSVMNETLNKYRAVINNYKEQ